MALTCNIDAKGKLVRFIYGIVLVLVGIFLLAGWAAPRHSTVGWIVSISCLVAGAFGMFEARAGWCIVRAMGFKTPI